MTVSAADGDAVAFWRTTQDPAAMLPQKPFIAMSDYELECLVAEEHRWTNGKVPEDFDALNRVGGPEVSREMAFSNADLARQEMKRRGRNPASRAEVAATAS